MARSTSLVSLLAMKLWTNSSIQTCQARPSRGTGAFLFVSGGVGEGLGSMVGVGDGSAGVGESGGDGVGTGVGEGRVGIGVGVAGTITSVFFCARNAQTASATRAPRAIAPITTGFHL